MCDGGVVLCINYTLRGCRYDGLKKIGSALHGVSGLNHIRVRAGDGGFARKQGLGLGLVFVEYCHYDLSRERVM